MQTALLLLGAALAVVLLLQLWRGLQLEAATREWEIEKATLTAERILQRARTSRAVFAAAPGEALVLRGDAPEIPATVGWLDPIPAAADEDLVVRDRLERAARAEFGAGDAAAARRELDELLAAALPDTQRMQVLAAAAFQARRAGDPDRARELGAELWQRAAALRPDELAREAIATAAAAAVRLVAGTEIVPAADVARVVALLPDELAAGLPADVDTAAQAAVSRRRAALCAARTVWQTVGERGAAGMRAGGDRRVLWWLPRDDGGHDARLLPVDDWLAAVRAAGGGEELAEWPWLVEPTPGRATDAFAGVPFVAGVQPSRASAAGTRPWLLPALTLALLVAFGLAVAQQLRAQRREAAAVRAQAEFLTTVTHELKTPLASIRLLGEMLVEGRAAGREQDYYRMLSGEAGRLSMLIENVLDLGRLERGERAYDLRPADVGEVVDETVALVAPLARQDGRAITVGAAAGPARARVDRAALAQALISLLDNARKYGAGPIDVAVARRNGAVRVGVRDHGPGVPAGERERIFERFARGAAHAHGTIPGVGIGLYLARVIARRLGGDLVCAAPDDGGGGAQFTLTLPAEPAAGGDSQEADA